MNQTTEYLLSIVASHASTSGSLLSNIQSVQVCDASKDEQRTKVKYTKISFQTIL